MFGAGELDEPELLDYGVVELELLETLGGVGWGVQALSLEFLHAVNDPEGGHEVRLHGRPQHLGVDAVQDRPADLVHQVVVDRGNFHDSTVDQHLCCTDGLVHVREHHQRWQSRSLHPVARLAPSRATVHNSLRGQEFIGQSFHRRIGGHGGRGLEDGLLGRCRVYIGLLTTTTCHKQCNARKRNSPPFHAPLSHAQRHGSCRSTD